MNNFLLFIQGGGEDGYEVDRKLAASLQAELGKTYQVHYPKMPSDKNLPDFGWLEKIGKEISLAMDRIILVGHSLGASMLLKYLSENRIKKNIAGIFLIATPYWSGNEAWKQGLKLQKSFANKIPKDIPLFFYQCKDDETVSLDQLKYYIQNLPQATVRIVASGGHSFNKGLSLVAKDIKAL